MALYDPKKVAWVEKIVAHWLSIISIKKNIFCSSHIKIAYTKKYITQKINQSIFSKVSAYYVWKQSEIWLQNCKIDTKNQCNACES